MSMQELSVKKPTPSDYNELITVWEASVRATHHFLSENDIYFLKPLVRNEYLRKVDLFCIRDTKKNIAAFIGIMGKKIELLFVRPDMMGNGLGKRLLDFVIGIRNVDRVDVNEQNKRAVSFYQRYGFKFTSRDTVDAMGKPYPTLHMVL